MPKTANRLSQYNALESSDRLSSSTLPPYVSTHSVIEWSIDEDVSYGDSRRLKLKVDSSADFAVGITVSVSGILASDVSSYSPTLSDPNPVSLNQNYVIYNIVSAGAQQYIYLYTELEWSQGEIVGNPTNAVLTVLYQHKWQCSGGTLSLVTDTYDTKSRYSLKVNPSGTEAVTLSLLDGNTMLLGDNGKDFSFNAKIYCNQLTKVSCSLTHSESSTIEPGVTTIYPGRFGAFRSNTEELPISDEETYVFDISFTMTGHGGQPFYITSPNLIEDYLFYSNPYVYSSRRSMPNFYWEMDSSQTYPSFPLHRLIDCLTTGARDVYEEYLRIYHYEPGQLAMLSDQYVSNDTHSTLVNPQYVDSRYAPWLSQFNGHRLKKNISYFYDGSTETTYDSPQELFTSVGAVESFIKWQLSTGYYGRASGTTEAIREAAKQVLHFTKDSTNSTYFVSITRHYQSDPFKVLIQTLVNETFDCSENGQESYAILDAVEMAKPMGFKIYHEAVDVIEFRIGDRLGTYPIGDTVD